MNRIFTSGQGRSRAILAGVCSIVFAASVSAQVTSVKLPKADSSASFQVQDSGSGVKMRVNADGGFYAGGTLTSGTIPATGAGVRMMWYPAKAAFRVGGDVTGTAWNDVNIGVYSTATGERAKANGSVSTAMGVLTTASGSWSTAMGAYSTAGGLASTAMGYSTTANDTSCTAMGWYTEANSPYSTAMGSYVSTDIWRGAYIIGDRSTTTTTNASLPNQMTMRFANGYRLFTSANLSTGVGLLPGGNSWGTISDSTKKTGFVKADHDYFLSSLSKLRLGSWNYKSQNAKNYRHYGPMAQEIFHYFGNDGKGTIGCDTLLASADMDGIMMVCLQALEKRTGELNTTVAELKTERARTAVLQSSINDLKTEMQKMKSDILLLAQAKSGATSGIALNTGKGQ